MKAELIIILALATALAFHRDGARDPVCPSSGCVILPLNFSQFAPAATAAR